MEDFVNFSIAKKLKENGFPQHIAEDAYIIDNYGENEYQIGDRLPIPLIPDYMDDIAAPTISQVLKWLREEKKYHIEFVGNACGYLFIISDVPSEGGTDRYCSDYSGPNDGGTWDKYEDCAIASIEYCLDNLI